MLQMTIQWQRCRCHQDVPSGTKHLFRYLGIQPNTVVLFMYVIAFLDMRLAFAAHNGHMEHSSGNPRRIHARSVEVLQFVLSS
jgi:hypothetical protein